jgi:tetratricopeptide (TPR) repeat protein
MSNTTRWRRALVVSALIAGFGSAQAQAPEPSPGAPANSALDAPLFYQLLIGEIELRAGEAGSAYEVILDAARRSRQDALFRRAVDIALQARAGDQALAATRAWRQVSPNSTEALRLQLQILSALNRLNEAGEPLRALLAATPEAERPGIIAALPRFMHRGADAQAAAALIDDVLRPYADAPATRGPAAVAAGRSWMAAGDTARALALARKAHADDASAPGPVLLALELMPTQPEAEKIVRSQLEQPGTEPAMRLAFVRALTGQQRYAEAIRELETLTKQRPEVATPYLSLGALYLELKRPKEGEAALRRYIELASKAAPVAAAVAAAAADDGDAADDEEVAQRPEQGITQAYLMLAQAAEQRGDFKGAEAWLAKVEDPQRALDVQTRRASLLVRQGKLEAARETIRRVPERTPEDARSKSVAEAGVMRDAKRWQDAFDVLAAAIAKLPADVDLLYEQAMMAEKLDRLDEMERLLRQVIAIKPDHAQAHNALGYSLADRNLRLPEAKALIVRALELSPGDPFITDSLGWVEYRLGNHDEALRLLKQAYAARPDPEIAAHLGEVLWAFGRRDEAKRVWTEAKGRDAANDVLRETLARLKVGL